MSKKIPNESHDKKYSTELKCLEALLDFRISKDGLCFNEKCKAPIKDYYVPLRGKKAFLCRLCLGHFHPMAGSPFERSHIELVHWFQSIYLLLSNRNGIASKEIERKFFYGYPAIFRMMHTIREMMGDCLDWSFKNTILEVDESYISTGPKGLGRHYRFKRGRGSERNANILVITERKGRAKLFVIPSSEADSIIPKISEEIDKEALIVTDEWKAYNALKLLGYQHLIVNHNDPDVKYKFKRGMASTNTAENIFSIIKRSVSGTYKNISGTYLPNYLNEFSFRHSYRDEPDYGFSKILERLKPLSEHYRNEKNDDNIKVA